MSVWRSTRRSIQLSYGRILGNSIINTTYAAISTSDPMAILSNTRRNLEPDADYFRFAKSLFQFFIHSPLLVLLTERYLSEFLRE